MKFFQNISIKNKLIIIILLSTAISIGVGSTLVTIRNINTYKEDMVNNTIINARLIGEYCIAPLSFRDNKVAADVIKKIATIPSISTGGIYDEKNDLFASYQKESDKELPASINTKEKYIFNKNNLEIFHPIMYKGVKYGTVYLKASTDILTEKINQQFAQTIALILGLLVLSYFIASKLQTVISKPILDLTNTTNKIVSEADYSHRVKKKGSDEIGLLYESFNKMLTQVNIHEEERNKAEELLRQSVAKYRYIVDTSLEGIWGVDKEDRTNFVNNRMAELLGYATEEIYGRPFTDFIFTSDVLDHQKIIANRRQGIAETYERRFYRKDGNVVWTIASATPIFDSNHKFNGSFGMFTDITERKLAEERINKLIDEQKKINEEIIEKNIELNRARNATLNIIEDLSLEVEERRQAELRAIQLAAIVEYSDDAIIGKTVEGIITSWNKGAENIYDYSQDEIIGKSISILIPPQHLDEMNIIYEQIKQGEHIEHFETKRLRKNGISFNVSLTISPVYNSDGNIIGISGIERDITERKRNEAINASRLYLLQFAVMHSLDDLLEETLNEAEKLTDSCVGFYHFVEDDQKSLILQNWSKRTKAEFCKAEGKGLHYSIDEAGVWVDCVYNRKPIIHNDYASLPNRKGMPEGHAEVIRELVVPVIRGEKIMAILGIGNKDSDYNEKDIEAISLLADLAWEIAERKRSEEALRQSEERFRRLAENAQDVIYRMSIPAGRYEYISPAALSLFGYSPEEFYTNPLLFKQAIHPDWHKYFEEQWANLIKGKMPPTYEYQIIHKTGQVRWLNQRNIIVRDDTGNPIAIEGIVTDITERRRAEIEIKATNKILSVERNMFIEGPVVVFKWKNEEGWPVEYVSPNVEKVFGYSVTELTSGKVPYADTIPNEDTERVAIEVSTYSKSGAENFIQSYRIIRKDRKIIWIDDYTTILRDENGMITHYQGYVIDITERKRVEDEIVKLNSELEQRVLDRTIKLEAANKELEAFAYSVSHDLRAPLRHIDGFLELLIEKIQATLDEEGIHYVTIISNSAKKMAALIDDLLSFSRMGRNEMSKKKVDLNMMIQEIISEFQPEMEGRIINWRISEIPIVIGDRAMLQIVMVNLISNALKFTRTRTPAEIEIGIIPAEGKEIIIYVHDNGVGFDMNYVDKLFGVFHRLHRSEEFEGTGIGLANVHRIISRHGGKTWAKGGVNVGATFYFSLPIVTMEKNHGKK